VGPEVARIDGLESAAAEISLMLRIAPVTATSRLDDALTLTARYPDTMTALAAERITLCKARILAEQTDAVNVRMRRRKQGETVAPFRERRDRPALEAVQERLAEWLSEPTVLWKRPYPGWI
jgi:hypothetical protein